MLGINDAPCLHPAINPAVQRCCEARNDVFLDFAGIQQPTTDNPNFDSGFFRRAEGSFSTKQTVVEDAANAFVAVLPPLDTRQNIKDYIACVLHGLAIGVIEHSAASRMIAGARIAASLLKDEEAAIRIEAKALPSTLLSSQKNSEK